MDIDLRLPSGEHDKEDKEPNTINNLLDGDEKLHNVDIEGRNTVDAGVSALDGGDLNSPTLDMAIFKEDTNLEPLSGMEFDSHGEAYSFYQEYARSMGFNTAIQNSRRSKTSREFIDAKFACSRYGTKREYDNKSFSRPRARQNKQEFENSTGRRSCSKTDCKASMHVKKRSDGKWVIHSFVKEHNHELLPAQAVSEQARKMYAAMARQFAEYKTVVCLKNEKSPFDKGWNLGLETGDVKLLLDFFIQMQNMNSNFFYAVDIGEDQRVKSLLWLDAKCRHDYINFCDVVSFDTTYVRNKYKMPLALFVGVNQHYQFMLLGCALISDETATTYSWLMLTWLKAVGGQVPKVIITDHDMTLKSVIPDVFPHAHHCMCLWHILGKVTENLGHVIKQHENFMAKFGKCIHRSWTSNEFEKRWWKMVDRFELRDDDCVQTLYEDCKSWVPTFMKDVFLGGMSTVQRSESINSFFDKYVHKKTSVQDYIRQYETILHDRYEEEAKADSDTWNKVATLKTPSPLEKSVAGIYTHAVFKKIQVEVIGAVACHPKPERQDDVSIMYKVHDMERNQEFTVVLNELKAEVSCICRLFEYKGYLCRHALIVLQYSRLSAIPCRYILKRWTRDAKSRYLVGEQSEQMLARVQRYNYLSQRVLKLSEEGSLSQESYSIAFHALHEAYSSCVSVNNSSIDPPEAVTSAGHAQLSPEDDTQSKNMGKTNRKKNPAKKKKLNSEADVMTVGAQENLQQMDKFSTRAATLDGYFGAQQSVQGMLNLMGPTRDNYYGNHQTIHGLGQLGSIQSSHDGYYGAQQSMPGLAQLDFFRASTGFAYGIRDDPNVRASQLHEDPSRHA